MHLLHQVQGLPLAVIGRREDRVTLVTHTSRSYVHVQALGNGLVTLNRLGAKLFFFAPHVSLRLSLDASESTFLHLHIARLAVNSHRLAQTLLKR